MLTPTSAALFLLAGVGLAFYFRYEKARLAEERGELSSKTSPYFSISITNTNFFPKEKEKGLKSYGRPQIGGPFSLSTHDRKPFTQENLLRKWSLVYFGFTNCPDICPAELDKVTTVLSSIRTRLLLFPSRSVVEALSNMSSREGARRYIFTCLHFGRPSSRYSIAY